MSTGSCETYPIESRRLFRSRSVRLMSSKKMLPPSVSYSLLHIYTIVLLPEPEGPTIAVDVPDLIVKLMPSKMSCVFSGWVG